MSASGTEELLALAASLGIAEVEPIQGELVVGSGGVETSASAGNLASHCLSYAEPARVA